MTNTETKDSQNTAIKKTREGIVVSDSQEKTIIVEVERLVQHSKYKKTIKKSKKYYVHDEHSKAKTGDHVRIIETRPLSKLKRWRLIDIIRST